MMLTFVSQCEKKALLKTRRVLDAFANRIGDNTWQTVMTEDGLIAVKNLLRKTATKNTAVSCHWIRSRSRSELVWIIGSRKKFNEEGIIPVNSTTKPVFMDIKPLKPIEGVSYANTHLQPLAEHLFAVGYVAQQFYLSLFGEKEDASVEQLAFTAFMAGCLHDIGKLDPLFQDWILKKKGISLDAEDGQHIDSPKFSFDKHPRHNEISVLLYQLLDKKALKEINRHNKKSIKHLVLWHHAKPFRKEKEYTTFHDIASKLSGNLKEETIKTLHQKAYEMLKQVADIEKIYTSADSKLLNCVEEVYDDEDLDDLSALNLPDFKTYDRSEELDDYKSDIENNAINNILRACVITADRMVSKLEARELEQHIRQKTLSELLNNALENDSNLSSHIEQCLGNFGDSERSKKQHEVSKNLLATQEPIAVLAGAAGCGKTKIALEWAQLGGVQKIIWVCPRVQVCQGIFDELTASHYLPNANIEIFTGEFKYTNTWDKPTAEADYFSGDVVITTIDQILGAIITHSKVDSLIDFLNAHVVFDEYHEYVNMAAFNLLFAELVKCKEKQGKRNTLLVSATPHYLYLEAVLGIETDNIIVMPSFNQSQYKLKLVTYDESKQDDSNPLYAPQSAQTFVISNTATTAQLSFIKNQAQENSVLFHSKFKRSDKQKLFEAVYECFKKNGDNRYQILRSGPIVQASLNISCGAMVSEISTAENSLQRLGRLNRFGENPDQIYTLQIAVPETLAAGKGTGQLARFLNRNHQLTSTKAWLTVLQNLEDKPLALSNIYEVYSQLYENPTALKALEEDMLKALKASVDLINKKVTDPFTIPKTTEKQTGQAKISKHSLRGENVFVQMAVCRIEQRHQPQFEDSYAYEFPLDDSPIDGLTASENEVTGYDDSSKNLVAHMQKKHHNIFGGNKAHKDFMLLKEARNPAFPIYLSYTPKDLLGVGGESARHSSAIYYAVCDKQPIGAISIKQLTNHEE